MECMLASCPQYRRTKHTSSMMIVGANYLAPNIIARECGAYDPFAVFRRPFNSHSFIILKAIADGVMMLNGRSCCGQRLPQNNQSSRMCSKMPFRILLHANQF
jgi:hypothetical protein